MATFDSGRQRYSMNFYPSHQRPLQRRSYTGRPSRPAEGQLRVTSVALCDRWLPIDFRYAPFATEVMWRCKMTKWAMS